MMMMVVLLLVAGSSRLAALRPFVTCVGCETFIQCFLTCPAADYPGINRQDKIIALAVNFCQQVNMMKNN